MANYIYKDGELYHAHKYIKKVPDGKGGFRYIYDDSYLKKAKQNYRSAEDKQFRAGTRFAVDKYNAENAIGRKPGQPHSGVDRYTATDNLAKSSREYLKADKELEKAKKKYAKAQIRNATAGTIAKGAAKVANLLAKLKKKKK